MKCACRGRSEDRVIARYGEGPSCSGGPPFRHLDSLQRAARADCGRMFWLAGLGRRRRRREDECCPLTPGVTGRRQAAPPRPSSSPSSPTTTTRDRDRSGIWPSLLRLYGRPRCCPSRDVRPYGLCTSRSTDPSWLMVADLTALTSTDPPAPSAHHKVYDLKVSGPLSPDDPLQTVQLSPVHRSRLRGTLPSPPRI